jgi:hypothetical protein
MATVYLSGKGAWLHHLFELDEFRGQKNWSATIYLDPKSTELFKELGLQQRVRENDEGKFVVFKRPEMKKWKVRDGESQAFDPPRVTDVDGNLWPTDRLIGNGSAITVKLDVYNTVNGKGARLDGVRVDEWVEYKRPEDVNAAQATSSTNASARPF